MEADTATATPSTTSKTAPAKPDAAAIRRWLTARIAASLELRADDIDETLPFSSYGLDSVAAIGLSGELEQWLGRRLPPTLTWDYPTIELLADHLAGH